MIKNYRKSVSNRQMLAFAAGLTLLFSFSAARAQQSTPHKAEITGLVFASDPNQPEQGFKSAAAVFRPGTSQDYLMNNGAWLHTFNSAYTYNASGYLTEVLKTTPGSNQNNFRQSYSYDAAGNELESTGAIWMNNAWETISGTKTIRTVNAQGKLAETIRQLWSNTGWVNQERTTFTYDAAGNLLEKVSAGWSNSSWLDAAKRGYQYTNGVITQITDYNKTNGAWVGVARSINITWHNQALLQPLSQTFQIDWGNGFENYGRQTVAYPANGGYVETNESYNNGTYSNTSRKSRVFDVVGNYVGQKTEYWNGTAWYVDSGEQQDLTYNQAMAITQRIHRNYNATAATYVDHEKLVYSNFQQFVSGVKPVSEEFKVAVYPNPARGILNLQLPESSASPMALTLTDLTGKTLKAGQIPTGIEKTKIEIDDLPAGIYLLKVSNGATKQTFKVLKN